MTNLASAQTSSELYEVEPREQAGGPTDERFEFQFHQAAAESLEVLDDQQVECIYFEFHDDYVIETAASNHYRFYQVKCRGAQRGMWTIAEFFGERLKKGSKVGAAGGATPQRVNDCIFVKMFDHIEKFGDRCEEFVFVSDNGVNADFETLLDDVRKATGSIARAEKLYAAISVSSPSVTKEHFYHFLRSLRIKQAMGTLGRLDECKAILGLRILEMSEVDLSASEQQSIGRNLVDAIRSRSHLVIQLPRSKAQIRKQKGFMLNDMLRLLSLSPSGYRELRANGRQAVLELSRLHRLLKRSDAPESIIPMMCRLKARWDAWWVAERHNLDGLHELDLRAVAGRVVEDHALGKLDFDGMKNEAANIAERFQTTLTARQPLTRDLVFGLILSTAVERA